MPIRGVYAGSSGCWDNLESGRSRPAPDHPTLDDVQIAALETSRPGVFAAGDVRSGSVKRVASAVGKGAMAVQFVHEFFKET
jgi:thioredoxin reductase